MLHRGLSSADLVITNSKWAESKINQAHPGLSRRVIVSYEGLQHDMFGPQRRDDDSAKLSALSLGPGYLLWVSNMYRYKRPELCLKAYARLSEEDRRRAPLVMIGGSWDCGLTELRRLSQELGIASSVHLLGWVDDAMLPLFYRNAAAFCLASSEETFGRCVVEAMASGAVCVLNDIPVLREVTAGHAIFVDFHDAASAAAALRSALFDSSVREHLREAARKRSFAFEFDTLARERMNAISSIFFPNRPQPIVTT
jgi:glycosyltransferase involved in cell wall biosynthesis